MARHAEMPQPCFLATFLSPRGVVSSGGVGGFCLLRDPWQGLETFSVVTTWGRVLLAGWVDTIPGWTPGMLLNFLQSAG